MEEERRLWINLQWSEWFARIGQEERNAEKDKSISLAATMSKNVIALATSLHGIGPLIQNGTFSEESGRDRTAVASAKRIFTCSD